MYKYRASPGRRYYKLNNWYYDEIFHCNKHTSCGNANISQLGYDIQTEKCLNQWASWTDYIRKY
jgi:hypothetical protein